MCEMRSHGSIRSSTFPTPIALWRSRTSRRLRSITTSTFRRPRGTILGFIRNATGKKESIDDGYKHSGGSLSHPFGSRRCRKGASGVSEDNMNGNYVFLCGLMWCKYGQQEAGSELMRAAQSEDPDLSALALAMLQEGCRSLPQFKRVN